MTTQLFVIIAAFILDLYLWFCIPRNERGAWWWTLIPLSAFYLYPRYLYREWKESEAQDNAMSRLEAPAPKRMSIKEARDLPPGTMLRVVSIDDRDMFKDDGLEGTDISVQLDGMFYSTALKNKIYLYRASIVELID